jgi:hypothetical protein
MEAVSEAAPNNITALGAAFAPDDITHADFWRITLSASELLSEVARLANVVTLASTDVDAAEDGHFKGPMPPKPLLPLYKAVAVYLSTKSACVDTSPLEACVQEAFFQNLDRYLPSAVRAIVTPVPGFVQDGFVRVGDDVAPVEVKRRRFTGSALRQLLRYMEAHGASRGIAVAPELGVALPDNITYVAVTAGEAR